MVLSERGLPVEMFCGVCGEEPETLWHLLIDCEVAWDCWQAAGLQFPVDHATEEAEGLADWLWNLIEGNQARRRKDVRVWFFIRHQHVTVGIRHPQACGCLPAHECEALCLLQAVKWTIHAGFQAVTFEPDVEVVVNRVNQGVEDHSEFGSIIHEIQEQ
ncbi:hypothetical protein LINPERPRIM_LOCUS37508 [Linum perenne]